MTNTKGRLDLESAESAYDRVRAEIEAISVDELSLINTDILAAASTALGVAGNILKFRERLARLPEYDLRYVNNLADYATAAWFAYVSNMPEPEPKEMAALIAEVRRLRTKLLMWAEALVDSKRFDGAVIAAIKQGSGDKNKASDLVALVNLYREKWNEVRNRCDVTEQDLDRGAAIGTAAFAELSRRQHRASTLTDSALRMRRAWTLLDRAYFECRRGIAFLRAREGDLNEIAPSFRRNAGRRALTAELVIEGPALDAAGSGEGEPSDAKPDGGDEEAYRLDSCPPIAR